jgi:YegS/Rv2252/BmrU family lipid kinase
MTINDSAANDGVAKLLLNDKLETNNHHHTSPMKKKWFAIVNPNAGSRKIKRDWPLIKSLLNEAGFDFEYVFTNEPLHAIELVKEAIEAGKRNFIAVGGDGTFNEVANGLFSQNNVKQDEFILAAIPVGTGNDWGRMFGIPADYAKAIDIIKKGKTFVQDVGIAEYQDGDERKQRYFVNIAGMGFDALVAQKTNKKKKDGQSGAISYFINLLTSLFEFKPGQVHIEVDDESWDLNTFSLTVGICRFNGGGMKQSPLAIPNDGLFDLTVIKKIGFFTIAMQLKNLYDGSFINHPKILTDRGEKVRVSSDIPNFQLEVDGEGLGQGPYEFSILPRALKVVVGSVDF